MTLDHRKSLIVELGFPETSYEKLEAYIDFLWKSNEKLNLFSRKMTFDDLIDNHLIDCLLPIKYFPKDVNLVGDFGSGGGLPGVLYAMAFPHVQFYLYEKSLKKRDFLHQCLKIVQNIEVHGEITPTLPKFDLVTSRAFKPINVMLEMSQTYYMGSGRYFLLKGRREKIDEEINLALKKFKNLQLDVIPLHSPLLDVERHLVLI